jgi:Fur family ferric uptake transcriptional regulator
VTSTTHGPPHIADRLKEAGLRITGPRVAVLTDVTARPHLTADQIAAAARKRGGVISTQAVYDVLAALTACNLVRRIEPAMSPARYETRVGDNHHHVVCRQCGAVADIDCAIGTPPCLEPADTGGFVIDEAEVTFWGICPDCQSATSEERD